MSEKKNMPNLNSKENLKKNEVNSAQDSKKKKITFAIDDDSISAVNSIGKVVRKRGMATVENTLNSMTGDISYEELAKVSGISVMALAAKANVSEVSIFQKKDYISCLKEFEPKDISYKNSMILSKFAAISGKMVPSRISAIDTDTQKVIQRAIKIARFLSLAPYVKY